ncbi:MAG: efflux RND transporter periplasmic adaptor subunit [Natronospirillum sp.]|uniref:efflux RND transporter periplasmic adaptor subunit n=1 Tax=Natronospirillum sp. TaxID=2812955 RepID=UPI0025D40FEF|nr:efflux RND transporter periplasmic adaptor subunit [Natronospirillum sp.]MCH8552686.1 efflux RND transporter periplasmic adaptor subunit [Natronospirillum sp.]
MRSIALCLLLGLAASASAQSPVSDTTLKPVRLFMTESEDTGGERRFYGRIAARETVDLAFQVGGQIVEFPAIEGSAVSEGNLLARLNLAPLERNVRQAELSLEQAQRSVARNQQLIERNAITQAQLEDSMTTRDQSDVQLEEARAALEDATLEAPFEGLVAERMVANRTTVSAGQPVLRLHDMSEIRVRIDVPERLLSEIGDPANLQFRLQLVQGGPQFDLELREFVAEAGRIGQSYVVTLALAEPVERTLLPGASATVIAQLPAPEQNGVTVPASAVQIASDRSAHVMVYTPTGEDTGRVERRAVSIDTPDGTTIRVVSGLGPGEEIVAAGAHLLDEGQAVRRFTGYRGHN